MSKPIFVFQFACLYNTFLYFTFQANVKL